MSLNSVSTYDVENIDFVIGGDHGIEAFCLIFQVIIKVRGSKILYIRTWLVAKSFAKKILQTFWNAPSCHN